MSTGLIKKIKFKKGDKVKVVGNLSDIGIGMEYNFKGKIYTIQEFVINEDKQNWYYLEEDSIYFSFRADKLRLVKPKKKKKDA